MPIIIGAAIITNNATYEAEIHIECSCQLGSGFAGACNHPELYHNTCRLAPGLCMVVAAALSSCDD